MITNKHWKIKKVPYKKMMELLDRATNKKRNWWSFSDLKNKLRNHNRLSKAIKASIKVLHYTFILKFSSAIKTIS